MAEAKWSGVLSTTEPRNDVGIIKVRQGNTNSEIVEFQIVQNNKPYDLTGLTVYFCASFGLNLVEKPAVVVNTTGGKIQYTFDDDSMQAVGRQKGYFSIKKEESKIDSTQDFEFQVDSSLMTRSIDGKSYIYKLSTLIKVLDDFIKNGQNNFNVWFESVKEILYGVDPGGNILRELIEARKNSIGNIFASLKARLDKNEDDTAAQFAQNIQYMHDIGVDLSHEPYSAKFDGTDETHVFKQVLIDYPRGARIIINGELTIKNIVFPETFKGVVSGTGSLKALTGVSIDKMVDLTKCSDITFDLDIDMSQTETTLPNDPRANIGIYMRDSRRITLDNITYKNCRIGRPFVISGSSNNSPNQSTDGSKYIYVNKNRIMGLSYDVVDEGCYPVISSDFYTTDDNGKYFSASNGVKTSDYTVDLSVTFPATTKYIFISDLYAENCDRVAILNVNSIKFTNCDLINFYTRGYNFSPTCRFFGVHGGQVGGGDATQLAAALGCSNGTFDSVKLYPSARAVGEKTSLKAYAGCEDITFNNITGVANYDRGVYSHSSKRITFSKIHLLRNSINVSRAIEVSASGYEYGSYTVEDIVFDDCYFEGSSILEIRTNVGNSKIALDGVRFYNCTFDSKSPFLYILSEITNALGNLSLVDCRFKTLGLQGEIPSKLLRKHSNNTGFSFTQLETITTVTLSAMQEFTNLFYYVPVGSDKQRNPNVKLYLGSKELIYGLDWFSDGTMFSNVMSNKIRLYEALTVPVGSKLTLARQS